MVFEQGALESLREAKRALDEAIQKYESRRSLGLGENELVSVLDKIDVAAMGIAAFCEIATPK